ASVGRAARRGDGRARPVAVAPCGARRCAGVTRRRRALRRRSRKGARARVDAVALPRARAAARARRSPAAWRARRRRARPDVPGHVARRALIRASRVTADAVHAMARSALRVAAARRAVGELRRAHVPAAERARVAVAVAVTIAPARRGPAGGRRAFLLLLGSAMAVPEALARQRRPAVDAARRAAGHGRCGESARIAPRSIARAATRRSVGLARRARAMRCARRRRADADVAGEVTRLALTGAGGVAADAVDARA